jgi:tripartite ATP-independent transporter DctM subunit
VSIEIVSMLTVGGLFVLLAMGVPLAFATLGTAIVLGLLLFGPNSMMLITSRIYTLMNNYVLVAVPMFVFMGCLLERGGVAERMFRAIHIWAGPIRGGLAVGTVAAATILAAMVGIIGAEIVTLGLVALPAMLARGYDRRIALGTICAGGSLGSMLPPSVVLIIYGLTANVSIGELFIAAILPGLLLATLYMLYILVRCALQPELGPPASAEDRDMPLAEKIALLNGLILPVGIIFAVMGSLYTGVATPTEAASIGILGALVAAKLNGRLTVEAVVSSVHRTGVTVGMLIWIFFGANALVAIYTMAGGTRYVQALIVGLPFGPLETVIVMMLILLVLGLFLDWIGIVLLTMPIFVPIIRGFDMDPVWFGILFCMNMQISYLSPPFGPAAFYLKGVAPPEISLNDIFRSVWPFVVLQIIAIVLVLFFPQIAMWLPGHMR